MTKGCLVWREPGQCATIAATTSISMAEELLNSIQPRSYAGIVSYLSPSSFLTITDFEKSTLALTNWLDLPASDQHKKGRKRCNPDAVFRVFGEYCDYEPSEVRAEMLTFITNDFNYFRDVSWLNLNMHKKSLSQWINDMRNQNTPADELAIFALSRMYRRHSVVYSKNRTWCTIRTSKPLSEKDVYLACDTKFVQTGPRNFVSLIKKPSSCMPVMQFERLENIYEGGYYDEENKQSTSNISAVTPGEGIEAVHSTTVEKVSTEPTKTSVDIQESTDNKNVEYCALHGCKISPNDTFITNEAPNGEHNTDINFPNASEVCKVSDDSTLNIFNPLEESEPNLDLCMTNQNSNQVNNNHASDFENISTKKCFVRVLNLSQEEIDFLSGPKLLPSFTSDNKVVTTKKLINTEAANAEKTPKDKSTPFVTLGTITDIAKHVTKPDPNIDEHEALSTANETLIRNLRPRRKTTVHLNYSEPEIEVSDGNSTDEYTPQLEKTQNKLDNKKGPSAARLAAQKRRRDKPKPPPKPQTSPVNTVDPVSIKPPSSPKKRKGSLNIKTVTLPKRIKLRSFKCPSCDHISRSEKERNQHHKTSHGSLKCAVCDDIFETPSGLHRHQYKHKDLNFMCETCGDKFPFSSQLKEHRITHLTGRGHTCFAKDCGKSFKNNSSLVRHLKVHSGKTYSCPNKDCDYSTVSERNLKSHLILHTDSHNYSCGKCGQAFKYHTQMSRHVNNKVCTK